MCSSSHGRALLAVAVTGGVDTFHEEVTLAAHISVSSSPSLLGNKGCEVLCGVHTGLVQFTVNTAVSHARGHISV